MLIDESTAAEHQCPVGRVMERVCIGSRCMAWREVKTQHGAKGFCGLAGMPANVAAPLLGQTLETVLSPSPGHQVPGRVLVPQ